MATNQYPLHWQRVFLLWTLLHGKRFSSRKLQIRVSFLLSRRFFRWRPRSRLCCHPWLCSKTRSILGRYHYQVYSICASGGLYINHCCSLYSFSSRLPVLRFSILLFSRMLRKVRHWWRLLGLRYRINSPLLWRCVFWPESSRLTFFRNLVAQWWSSNVWLLKFILIR